MRIILEISRHSKTFLEVDIAAIRDNVKMLKEYIGSGKKLMAVVKDDAYGMGMERVSRAVLKAGVDGLSVADLAEASFLREKFPEIPILILGPSFIDGIEDLVDGDVTPVVSSLDYMERLNEAAEKKGRKVNVHLLVDTGMGRIGIWHEKALDYFEKMINLKYLRIEGLCSHFSCADEPEGEFTRLQLDRFKRFLDKLDQMGIQVPLKHIANSEGTLRFREAHFNMVRAGLSLFGVAPSPYSKISTMKPALRMKSSIAFIKDVDKGRTIGYGRSFVASEKMRVATLPLGYSHGFDRRLSNRGEVLVRGCRARVLGSITMDQIMIDITHIPGACIEDEVVVIGQQADQTISVEDFAERIGTVSHEVLCLIGPRVPKRYIDSGE
ncbi:MAG: alanine racemase [Candidatus Theseobacter exili]|nr:alanine racemase [Candidatus Theseobacter exili]